ncbi:MAG: hypothetical protein B6I22_07335 [Desulfobacteraceae bacterium 4572_123]|nr:MAG: hypothetical protein B6I22_07335 [Desulfobacteraceae bacterium 4572_123]
MELIKKRKWILFLLFVFCLTALPALAKEPFRLGWLQVEPGVGYQGEYNDNIYREKSNTVDDYINTLSFGCNVRLQSTHMDNFVRLGYHGDFVSYMDNSDNNYITHKPDFALNFRTAMGLYLEVKDQYLKTEDPYGSANTYGEGDMVDRWNNDASMIIGYEFADRYAVEIGYQNYMQRYENDIDKHQDRIDNAYSVGFFYKLTGKTTIFGQFRMTDAEYDRQNDGLDDWNSGNSQDYALADYFIGARFDTWGKLSGTVKIGYGTKSYDNDQDQYGNKYEDSTQFISETTLSLKVTPKSVVGFHLQRSIKGAPDEASASFVDTSVGLKLTQTIVDRLKLHIGVEWVNTDYEDENPGYPEKYHNMYKGWIGTTYKISEWLRFGAQYEYKSRNTSNAVYDDEYEYDNNIFSLNANLLF